jgi:hypothetical protein
VLARLKPGVSVAHADAEIRATPIQIEQEYQFNANWSAKAVPLTPEMYGQVQTPLFVLMSAV